MASALREDPACSGERRAQPWSHPHSLIGEPGETSSTQRQEVGPADGKIKPGEVCGEVLDLSRKGNWGGGVRGAENAPF